MTTLIVGFFGLVLIPATVLALILGRLHKAPSDVVRDEDPLKFTFRPD